MALDQSYYNLWFKSFRLKNTSGHRSEVQLSLLMPQLLPDEIAAECAKRGLDPFGLLTECSETLFYDYPVGTKFQLKATLTDRKGKGLFLYSYYGWTPIQIIQSDGKP